MPSFAARLTGWVLRTTKFAIRQYGGGPDMQKYIDASRVKEPPEPPGKPLRGVETARIDIGGRPVWTLSPEARTPKGTLLYFHGGGYVYPISPLHWGMLGRLAREHDLEVVVPLYPLTPEHTAAEVTAWALTVYRQFAERHRGRFVIGGDSAGGGLAAVTAMAARDAGLRAADGMVLICPWLDARASDPAQPVIEPRDAILRLNGIHKAGVMYAGNLPLTDPRVSPSHGNWSGLPPVLMYGGGDDILVTDARALKAKLSSARYTEQAGLMHDWVLFNFPEARKAHAEIAEFVVGV
jgi:acetyl esterase/lipase